MNNFRVFLYTLALVFTGSVTAETVRAPFRTKSVTIGNSSTAATNIKLHRGATGIQFVDGDDTTADGTDVAVSNAKPLVVSSLGIGENAPLTLLHVFEGDSGVTVANDFGIIIESNNNAALSINTPNTNYGLILFGDPEDNDEGTISYNHNTSEMDFITEGVIGLTIEGTANPGYVGIRTQAPAASLHVEDNSTDDTTARFHANKDGGYAGNVVEISGTRGPNAAFNLLDVQTNSAEVFQIQGDGDTVLTVQDDGAISCPDGGNICSGAYSPADQGGTCTPGTLNNIGVWNWMRVGAMVTVIGNADFNCSGAAGTLFLNLPIASNFDQGNGQDLAGSCTSQLNNPSGSMRGDITNDVASIQFSGAANQAFYCHFSYVIK